jgi:trehalose 6-phosphate synthase
VNTGLPIVVSHRGPFRFLRTDDGGFEARRGAGGVVSALGPLLISTDDDRTGAAWVAAAVSDDDRAAIGAGVATAPGLDLHLLDLDPDLHRLHYGVVSNSVLWFAHHGLFDLPRRPRFDRRFREAWAAYVEVNQVFADCVAGFAREDQPVLVQDYQLALVPGLLLDARPELRVQHFTHTPFAGPNSIRVLPDEVADAICGSMARVPCGFHTTRWARAYEASAREALGSRHPLAPTFVAPLGPDPEAIREVAASDAAIEAGRVLDELVGDRALILRSDRIDPSKNLVRGFQAYDVLFETFPEWRERVVFVAMLNSTREDRAEYLAYRDEVDQAAARVNERWGNEGWRPVVVDTRDDFPRNVAGLERYDVLLVNPLKDGLNLVAKEGPILNQRDGVVCLSRDAGAYDELAGAVLPVHPFDLDQTAAALHAALSMPTDERRAQAAQLRVLSEARAPSDWLADLMKNVP